ncbi:putative sporulation protein YtxC [Clostridium akagii]|uniref:putative sporulation protein YtxC n=1 Tax=Clostridium akagii TaxID=91623 RepID=UPI00047C874C|nr:putative sporulation protein YtxC [Clostridium akagii]
MLLKSIVYSGNNEEIITGLDEIKYNLEVKGIKLGISEVIENTTHFIKIFCGQGDFTRRAEINFNLYLSMLIYKFLCREFFSKKIDGFINETYFFLKEEEISEVKNLCIKGFLGEGKIKDESEVYCINRKNSIIKKITDFISENDEINIQGYIRFRIKEMEEDFESIVDKIIEKYMVEKEYDEFIKLLKYFVDIQECKIDEVNIFASKSGEYRISDRHGNDITDKMSEGINATGFNSGSTKDDLIMSGLITLAPKKVIIHCLDYFTNKELVETIKKVFEGRVDFCDSCKSCKELMKNLIKN